MSSRPSRSAAVAAMAAQETSRPTEPLVSALARYMSDNGCMYTAISKKCGLSYGTVFNVSNGTQNPSYRIIKALHDGLGISYDEMFGDA